MRATVKPLRVIVLSVLLAVTAALVHLDHGQSVASVTKRPLQQGLSDLGPWHAAADIPLDTKIVDALHLDDFLFRTYQRDAATVTVYIGYYRTAAKVGAAHDPLICFQGQGWKIDQRDQGSYSLARRRDLSVSYSSMLADRQDDRQLILYWFQVNGKAVASTPSQKLAMMMEKISGNREENAFVRLSTPIGSGSTEAAKRRILEFMEEFYPEFVGYVSQG